MARKKKVGRPSKSKDEKLVQINISLPADAITYLGEEARINHSAGTASVARLAIMEWIRRQKSLQAGAWKTPEGDMVTTEGFKRGTK